MKFGIDPGWSLAEEWRHAPRKNADLEENWFGFERWKQLAECFLAFEQRYPDRFRLLRYEDLVRDPRRTQQALFDFCDLASSEQTHRFITDSTSRNDGGAYGVYRYHGTTTTLDMDESIAARVADELRGTPLSRFLST